MRQRHVIPQIIQTDRENAVEKYINLDGLANTAENYARIILENRPKTCLRMDTVAATQIENGAGFSTVFKLILCVNREGRISHCLTRRKWLGTNR